MDFRQLNQGPCKTYLIASAGDAMLVDPVLEQVDDYLAEVASRDLRLVMVLDTHVHADHISGCAALVDRTGADYVMHRRSAAPCVSRRVDEGDELTVGRLTLSVLHTPGHTQDGICLVLPDRLLTGDFLFIGEGGAGRTDLPGGDAGEHWDSLQKLRQLPDDLLISPAHDYHGRDHSTLGAERRQNPRFESRTREEYVDWLESQRLGPAAWMGDVIRANYACAQDPKAAWVPLDQPSCEVKGTSGNVNAELVRTLDVGTLAELLEGPEPPLVLDVRERDVLHGEIPTLPVATHIPLGELTQRLNELEEHRGRTLVTVCRSGGRSSTAAAVLSVAGFEPVYSLDGGMQQYHAARRPTRTPRARGSVT